MEKLSKSDPLFYQKIANMRKTKSGGKYFKNVEAARDAQKKAVESRLRAAQERAEEEKRIQNDTTAA